MTSERSYITSEELGTGFSILLSQGLPPWLGHPVAWVIAWFLSLFPLGVAHRGLRLNQWVASGKTLTRRQLRRAVRAVLLNQGRSLYDFYHNLDRPDEVRRLVKFTNRFSGLVEQCRQGNQPTLMLLPHISGFNLGGLRLAQEGLKFLILSYPNPSRGYQWQNRLRNERGMEVVPMTVSSLTLARERLQAGGTVLTGIDRPIEDSRYHPRFFDCRSSLPVGYIRLAFNTRAKVFVIGFLTLPDHTCLVDASDEVILERNPDPVKELELNAEKVLRQAEQFICRDPSQWMMFYPVWPQEQADLDRIR